MKAAVRTDRSGTSWVSISAPCPAAVVFDLDGTLVETMTVVPTVYADTIRAVSPG